MERAVARYTQIVAFRVMLAVVGILTVARAAHEWGNSGPMWLTASILSVGAAASMAWPLVVPGSTGAMSVYTVGPAFLLAGMFLVPPATLMLGMAFAVILSGLIRGTRAYRTLFHLSAFWVVFGGFALVFRLGPRPSDILLQPVPRVGLELMISASAMVGLLIVRSVALRLEQGGEAPHWGAFQGASLGEAILCLAFATTITVLARIHIALLAVVGIEVAMVWFFLQRYASYASATRETRAVLSVLRPLRPLGMVLPVSRSPKIREETPLEAADEMEEDERRTGSGGVGA